MIILGGGPFSAQWWHGSMCVWCWYDPMLSIYTSQQALCGQNLVTNEGLEDV